MMRDPLRSVALIAALVMFIGIRTPNDAETVKMVGSLRAAVVAIEGR
jgi:energy-converting hydrogenase Eha subunit B